MSHCLMDKIVKFNAQSGGRDRLFRLLQYGSRFVWAYMEKCSYDKDTVNKLKNLEYSLSTARKLYRFGKSADIFYAALNSINLEDLTLRFTLTFSRINMALYLLTDHILWLGRVGLADIDKAKWSRVSYKLWLYYLVMNLTRDLYEILRVISHPVNSQFCVVPKCMKTTSTNSGFSKLYAIYQSLVHHKDITLDTIKNGCDVCIPLTQLGYLTLSPGTIGLLGVMSSIAGMIPIFDHTSKLTP